MFGVGSYYATRGFGGGGRDTCRDLTFHWNLKLVHHVNAAAVLISRFECDGRNYINDHVDCRSAVDAFRIRGTPVFDENSDVDIVTFTTTTLETLIVSGSPCRHPQLRN